MKTIALFGGTFDPIHNGHLQSALELTELLVLDELRLVPCHLPPHDKSPGANSQQRLAMVELAVNRTGLLVDDREIKRDGPSYSVETLEQLRREQGENVSLIWVMGSDAFAGLDRWYRWQDFLSLAHIVVLMRPEADLPQEGAVADCLQRHQATDVAVLQSTAAGAIYVNRLTPYPISSTWIRQAIADQKTPGSYLPASVLHYIESHQLYR